MGNLDLYDAVRAVPAEAQKKISGGRLSGKTDINPVWRIKALTEQFGPCGVGWKYEILRLWLEPGAKDEIAAFSEIRLYIKTADGWSDGIPGIGGSMFVANEKSGLYTSDECYKMATTDALSVACKALGIGADIYWEADKSKYDTRPSANSDKTGIRTISTPGETITQEQAAELMAFVQHIWTERHKEKLLELSGYTKLKDIPQSELPTLKKKLEALNGTDNGQNH